MRPTHTLPNGKTVREITIWKAIVLGILTLGIYLLVVVYQNTRDIQEARAKPFGPWQVFFWIGIFLSPLQLVNYAMNVVGLTEFRKKSRMPDSPVGWVAFALLFLLGPVGNIVWAVHFNGTIRAMATGNRGPAARAPAARPA